MGSERSAMESRLRSKLWCEPVVWFVSLVVLALGIGITFGVHAQTPIAPVISLVTLTPVLDVFHGVLSQNTYILTKQPAGNVMVFLNGLLQVAPDDYTLNGTTLTFAVTVDTPIVQILYWAQ
jgi:hypothetical protein